MSKLGAIQWLKQNGHKQLVPPARKQIKIYEYKGFVLEQWIVLNVPPISKRDAFNNKRFDSFGGEETEKPFFKEYKKRVLGLLPDLDKDEKSYLDSNEFCLKINFSVHDKMINSFGLIEPFLRILKQKYSMNQVSIRKIETDKLIASPQISFVFQKLTLQSGDSQTLNKTL